MSSPFSFFWDFPIFKIPEFANTVAWANSGIPWKGDAVWWMAEWGSASQSGISLNHSLEYLSPRNVRLPIPTFPPPHFWIRACQVRCIRVCTPIPRRKKKLRSRELSFHDHQWFLQHIGGTWHFVCIIADKKKIISKSMTQRSLMNVSKLDENIGKNRGPNHVCQFQKQLILVSQEKISEFGAATILWFFSSCFWYIYCLNQDNNLRHI